MSFLLGLLFRILGVLAAAAFLIGLVLLLGWLFFDDDSLPQD